MYKYKAAVIAGLLAYAGIDGIAQFENMEDEKWESAQRALARPPDTNSKLPLAPSSLFDLMVIVRLP